MVYFEVLFRCPLFLWQYYEFQYSETFQDFTAIVYLSFGKIISSNAIRITIICSRNPALMFLFFLASGNLFSDSNGTLFHLCSKFCYHCHCSLLKNTFCIRFLAVSLTMLTIPLFTCFCCFLHTSQCVTLLFIVLILSNKRNA